MSSKEIYDQASEIVEAKLSFYKSLITYALIIGFAVAYNIYQAGDITWSKWVIFGLSFNLLIQWHSAFVENGVFDKKIKEKMIKKEIQKLS